MGKFVETYTQERGEPPTFPDRWNKAVLGADPLSVPPGESPPIPQGGRRRPIRQEVMDITSSIMETYTQEASQGDTEDDIAARRALQRHVGPRTRRLGYMDSASSTSSPSTARCRRSSGPDADTVTFTREEWAKHQEEFQAMQEKLARNESRWDEVYQWMRASKGPAVGGGGDADDDDDDDGASGSGCGSDDLDEDDLC